MLVGAKEKLIFKRKMLKIERTITMKIHYIKWYEGE